MKPFDLDDPMELTGVALPGDHQEAMAECFVEEYMMQGWADDMILRLFTDPVFVMTHAVYRARGEPYVRDLIARSRARWGQVRFHTQVPSRPPAGACSERAREGESNEGACPERAREGESKGVKRA